MRRTPLVGRRSEASDEEYMFVCWLCTSKLFKRDGHRHVLSREARRPLATNCVRRVLEGQPELRRCCRRRRATRTRHCSARAIWLYAHHERAGARGAQGAHAGGARRDRTGTQGLATARNLYNNTLVVARFGRKEATMSSPQPALNGQSEAKPERALPARPTPHLRHLRLVPTHDRLCVLRHVPARPPLPHPVLHEELIAQVVVVDAVPSKLESRRQGLGDYSGEESSVRRGCSRLGRQCPGGCWGGARVVLGWCSGKGSAITAHPIHGGAPCSPGS